MNRGGLRRSTRLLDVAMLALLGCGRVIADGGTEGDVTGSHGPGEGNTSTTGTEGTADTDGSSASVSSPPTTGQDTGSTGPDCGVVRLADVARGTGGFAMDGEVEEDVSGRSVGAAGDMNGDGLDDIIIGAPWADPDDLAGSGRTYVIFGKVSTDKVSLAEVAQGIGGFTMDGELVEDFSGGSVSGAGDVNGDGLPDVLVGTGGTGRTYVVFGKASTAPVYLAQVAAGIGGFALDGEGAGGFPGHSVSGAGDVNGDGLHDIVLGAAWRGRAYVVFGKTSTEATSLADVRLGIGGFALDGEAAYDYAGLSVGGAGDVNGDGLDDLVVGAPGVDLDGALESGRAYVVFGKTDTDNVPLADVALGVGGFAIDGEADGDHAGASVGGAGDVNGDGRPDVVVGAGGTDRAYVVLGKGDTDRVDLQDVAGGSGGFALEGSGEGVSAAGDLNGDGLAEVMVGACGTNPSGMSFGRAYVAFGKEDTDPVVLDEVARGLGGFVVNGEAAFDSCNYAVRGAGDVDGNGIPDILIGASYADPNAIRDAGRTYVVFGGDFSCEDG